MKVVIGVTGSVAAIRVPELVRKLVRAGHTVECAMTEAACGIIHPDVLEWASGNKTITRLTGAIEHVMLLGLEGTADALIVMPATSNTISKIANGIDDTPVTTMAATALGANRHVIIVPAMHQSMYDNPFVKRNIQALRDEGIIIVDPRIMDNKAKIACDEDIIGALEALG